MTRSEFLEKLRDALANDLDEQAVRENVVYYQTYIDDEVKKGRTEAEVLEELGDPWVIARSIIDSAPSTSTYQKADGSSARQPERRQSTNEQYYKESVNVFAFDTWWKKLILILGILAVIMIVVAIVGGIFTLLAPFIIPLVIILIVVRVLNSGDR